MSLRVAGRKVDSGGASRRHPIECVDDATDGILIVHSAVMTPELSDSAVVVDEQPRVSVACRPADGRLARTDPRLDTLVSAS